MRSQGIAEADRPCTIEHGLDFLDALQELKERMIAEIDPTEGIQLINVQQKPADEGYEVGRIPVAVDEGLAETEFTVFHKAHEKALIAYFHIGLNFFSEPETVAVSVSLDF
jgi:hypothetical protein